MFWADNPHIVASQNQVTGTKMFKKKIDYYFNKLKNFKYAHVVFHPFVEIQFQNIKIL